MVQIQRKLDVFVLFYGAYKGVICHFTQKHAMKIKLLIFLIFTLTFINSCNDTKMKEKELELKEKELDLKNKELDIEKAKITKLPKSENVIEKKEEKVIELNYDSNNSFAFVKDIFSNNGSTYITLDFVEVKYPAESQFKVVNNNLKLRTFLITTGTTFFNCDNRLKINKKNILSTKNKLISISKSFPFLFKSENGNLTEFNIYCFN